MSRTQPSSAPLSSDQVPINGSADSNALGILSSLMDGSVETDTSIQEPGPSLGTTSHTQPSQRIREKMEPTSAELIQPKAEYLESEENVEDLTLDDDDDTGMDAGPSQRQGSGMCFLLVFCVSSFTKVYMLNFILVVCKLFTCFICLLRIPMAHGRPVGR